MNLRAHSPILLLMLVLALSTAHAQDAETNPDSPYKNMLAQNDSGSGISGASDAAPSDATPQEEAEKPKPKKKKSSSWWPFGHKDSSSKKKKTEKAPEAGADSAPVDSAAAGADSAPAADPAPLAKDETLKPAKEGGDAAAATGGLTPEDKAASEARLKQMQENLPAEITERAKRGESRIKDLLDKAQAIKARQGERDKEAQEERLREEQRALEHEREARRLRAMAAAGQLPEEDPGVGDDGGAGSKADKVAKLLARKEELIQEGAPQDRLDRIDAQISALQRKTDKPATTAADKKKKKKKPALPDGEEPTEVAKKPAKKTKSSKAAKTGKTAPAKSKEKTAKAPAAADDAGAPSLPMDSAPEPAPAAPAGDEAAPAAPKKKKKKKPAADAGAGAAAPADSAPAAAPTEGNEFKLDTPTQPAGNGL